LIDSASPRGSAPVSTAGSVIAKIVLIFVLLYFFLLAITLLSTAFNLMGKGVAESLLQATSNPIAGVCIGLLATSIVQSSSTTTSLIVGLVGAGALSFENAVPMIMGANIGTTVTNTMVSLAHIRHSDEFRRAFAGSTVHDFFNLLAVAVLLILESLFGIISVSSHIVEAIFEGAGGIQFASPVKALTKPVAGAIVGWLGKIGWLTALSALLLLFLSLTYIVKTLKSLVLSRVERFFHRYVFRNQALCFALGIVVTTLVQSSSVTTSLAVPLVGAGVITLSQIFPYTLGANIGTTITAFMASLAVGHTEAVSIAFAHLLFNIYGTLIFWPLKRIPIYLAESLANWTQRSRLIPVAYVLVMFYFIPAVIVIVVN
jgi:sodium-dependent phosphate cotransporter